MNNVIIFGAGASKKAGAPLMYNFLDVAEELFRKDDSHISNSKEQFKDVFNATSELQGIYAKSFLNIDNIETLFSAIEMGILLKKFSNRKISDIRKLRNSIITVIFKTLEISIKFPVRNSKIYPPYPYHNFISKLFNENTKKLINNTSFITFNYDLALDYSCYFQKLNIDYGLEDYDKLDFVKIYKLHGSINWGLCPKCNTIVPYNFKNIQTDQFLTNGNINVDLGSRINELKHCDQSIKSPPMIVPPTWNKTQYQTQLAIVWQNAAKNLAKAENIFIVGYSLPETDSFFKYLYALGSESTTRIKRFWVIDPDENGIVEERYRKLIGKGIENRFRFLNKKFEESISLLVDEITAT